MAIHVLDRFHVMQKMSKAIDKVRAAEVEATEGGRLRTVAQRGVAGCC